MASKIAVPAGGEPKQTITRIENDVLKVLFSFSISPTKTTLHIR